MSTIAPEHEHPQQAFGWAARDTSGILSPFKFSRRATEPEDVTIRVFYCRICHTDLHFVRNEFGFSVYPLVPGHDIVGIVLEAGSDAKEFKVGNKVGVGCLVGTCHTCEYCKQSLECLCSKMISTYNSTYSDGTMTYGGYSDKIVVHKRYVFRIPENLPLNAMLQLFYTGTTVYSPMKYYSHTVPAKHIGAVGLGGLGPVAVKFAKAFGLKVTVISTSPISAYHELVPLIILLKPNGKLILVGAREALSRRKLIGGGIIGGMKETQEMIDFCFEHNFTAEVEVIKMDYVNTAIERLAKVEALYLLNCFKLVE
ncbi:hypothetical protein AMTRI_Chr11g151390 [Amborella trichopoda]